MSAPKFAFRVLVLTLAGMVLVYFGVGAVLADRWTVDTVRPVKADPQRIAAAVGDFATWPEWATITPSLGPSTTRTVSGTPGTVGHRVAWSGSQGEASMTLTRAGADGIAYAFTTRFPGETEDRVRGTGTIQWTRKNDATEVWWHEESPLGAMYERWFAWFGAQQEAVRRMQASSLAGLQRKLE